MGSSSSPPGPPRCIALAGPTASGKTAVALALAREHPVEIVSVDSALVFRDMDIGTAKPSAEEQALCPHHLIDIVSPEEAYSAARFAADARRLIGDMDASLETVVNHPKVRAHLRDGLLAHNKAVNGVSSMTIARAMLMAEPPSIDGNELTDKGYINQRAGLEQVAPRQQDGGLAGVFKQGVHAQALPVPEARSTALSTRSCEPQRHRLPASAAWARSRVGRGVAASRATQLITMPLVQ